MYDDDKRPDDSKRYHAREGSVPYKIHAALVASDVLALIGRRAQARYTGSGNTIDAARVRRRLWSGGTTGSLFPYGPGRTARKTRRSAIRGRASPKSSTRSCCRTRWCGW
jgi:hypothetical protein